MLYFNQKAARDRSIARAKFRTNLRIRMDGYAQAVLDGREAAAQAMPILQEKYDFTLAHERAVGRTQIDAALDKLRAEVAAIPRH